MSSLGSSMETAGDLLTLIGLLSAASLLLVMANNIGNPDFPMIEVGTAGIIRVANAAAPWIEEIIVLGFIIWGLSFLGGSRP